MKGNKNRKEIESVRARQRRIERQMKGSKTKKERERERKNKKGIRRPLITIKSADQWGEILTQGKAYTTGTQCKHSFFTFLANANAIYF